MTDIVERLRLIARRQTVTAEEFEQTLYKAADEIELLRAALLNIACGEGSCGCDIRGDRNDECLHGIARAALGEKE